MIKLLAILLTFNITAAYSFTGLDKFIKKAHDHSKLHKKKNKGGGMDGGGTGSVREEEGAAWFYIDKPGKLISVCINRSPNFKASLPEIRNVISNSFNTWDNYISSSDLYEWGDVDDNDIPIPYPERLKILSKINFEPCSKTTELTFYFGVKDQRVQEVLEGLNNPKGFAYRKYKEIDAVKGTSRGIVWIFDPANTPDIGDDSLFDWSKTNLLQAIVNHEIGHVMGNGHFPDTIMRIELDNLIRTSQDQINPNTDPEWARRILNSRKYLTTIDHNSKLLSTNNVTKGEMTGSIGLKNSAALEESFHFFMKRKPVGDVKVKIKEVTPESGHVLTYELQDQKSVKEFTLTSIESSGTVANYGNVTNKFKRVRKTWDPVWGPDFEIENAETFSFTLHIIYKFKGMKPFPGSFMANPGIIGYSESLPPGIDWAQSQSPFAFHFTHPNYKNRILFIEKIEGFDFSDDEEDESDLKRLKPVRK